jgi:hypothetical protein
MDADRPENLGGRVMAGAVDAKKSRSHHNVDMPEV